MPLSWLEIGACFCPCLVGGPKTIIGAGWMKREYEGYDLTGDGKGVPPGWKRADQLIETVKILKGMFSDPEFVYESKYWKLQEAYNYPLPVQQPMPIIVGGSKPYAEMIHNSDIIAVYKRNAKLLQRSFPDIGEMLEHTAASTDMGNISHAMPAIHPSIGINSLMAINHQPEFAKHCISEAADKAIYDGALALAWTAIDLATDSSLRNRLMNS